MVQQTTTDVALPGQEVDTDVTTPVETQEPIPEPTHEELKTKVQTIEAEKADLQKRLTEASRAMTRKEFEALGREVAARLDKLDKAIEVIAQFTLSDKEIEEEAPRPTTAYDHYKKIVKPNQPEPVQNQPPEPPEAKQVRDKIKLIMGENGKVKPEYRNTYLTVKGFWEDGDLDSCNDVLDEALKTKAKSPEIKVPVDRTQPQGGGGRRVWTKAEIDNMSDAEYIKNRESIGQAQAEGRIK